MLMMRTIKLWSPWTSSKPQQVRQSLRNSHSSASPRHHLCDSFRSTGYNRRPLSCRQCLPWTSGSGRKSPHTGRKPSSNARFGIAFFSAMSVLMMLRGNLRISTTPRYLYLGYSCRQTRSCHRTNIQPKRVIQYLFDERENVYRVGNETHYDPKSYHYQRFVPAMGDVQNQQRIKRAHYVEGLDEVETDDCKLRYEWQKSSRPTCNSVHEFDMTTPWSPASEGGHSKKYRIIGYGYWRDVWIVNDDMEKVVFKSMRYEHDFTLRNFDRMRRDAAVMDRLTFSENIIDLFGFCGTSSLSEYGDGGDIITPLENEATLLERLQIGMLNTAKL